MIKKIYIYIFKKLENIILARSIYIHSTYTNLIRMPYYGVSCYAPSLMEIN